MAETKSPLLRAYLIVGSDELKRQAAVARIKRYVDEGLVDFNLDELTASADMDPASLVASLDTMPFGPGPRLVIVHDAGKLPKAVSEALITYLDNPNPSSVLCLEAESLAKGTRLYKAVAKQDGKPIVECAAKKAWELPAYVAQLCQRTHGKRMGEAAAKELVGRVGESTVLLDAQVRTLAELVGDRPEITLADVEEHVARTAEVKPWEFLDAVSGRDARRALALYQSMTDPSQVALLTLLVGRIRELACARSLAARGEGASLARALGKQEWQVKNHLRWARGFSDGDLERALVEAAALERILKAAGAGKLISLHGSGAEAELLDLLEKTGAAASCDCILHWYAGPSDQLQRAIGLGCYFSVSKRMLKTKRGREYARIIPVELLLLESDMPSRDHTNYTPSQWNADLTEALLDIAEIRSVGTACLLEAMNATSERLLNR